MGKWILAFLIAAAVLFLCWKLRGVMLTPVCRGKGQSLELILRVSGASPELEATVDGLLWLINDGVLFGRIVLLDDGMDEDAARIGAMAAALALRAFLEGPATAVERALREAGADEPHSVRCPVCGGEAAVAQVSGAPAGQGRAKRLWCAQCGCAWEFERVRCVRCGTQNQSRLHYFNLEGDEAHRLATCDECGGYTRTVYEEDALAPFSFEVEDVVMAKLDLVAYQRAAADAAAEAQR